MMKQSGIPYLSLDWLVMGFTNGIPDYGIHDKLWPNEIAEKFWSFLKAMCENMIWEDTDCIIEGEAVLPELLDQLLRKHHDKIRVCFVGYTNMSLSKKVKDVYNYSIGENDWLTKESDDYVRRHIGNMIEYSKRIKKSCEKHGLKYFDTSDNFTDVLDDAIEYLLKKE